MAQHVFVAHSSSDENFVKPLVERLRSASLQIWYAPDSIAPGADWNESVEDAILTCRKFVVVLSPEAVLSRRVKREIEFAESQSKTIVPIVHKLVPVPFRLITYQYIDFTTYPDDEQPLLRLVQSLDGTLVDCEPGPKDQVGSNLLQKQEDLNENDLDSDIDTVEEYPKLAAEHPGKKGVEERKNSYRMIFTRRIAQAYISCRLYFELMVLARCTTITTVLYVLFSLFNGLSREMLGLLGENIGWQTTWFVLATILLASTTWWATRVMFYFRFENIASHPSYLGKEKLYYARQLGATVIIVTALALFRTSFDYSDGITGPAGRLRLLALVLLMLAFIFLYVTARRRIWLARWIGGPRPVNLRSLHELPWQAWVPLLLAAGFGFALMILFAYRAVDTAPYLGAATIAPLAMIGVIPVGTLLVYFGNRARVPVVTLAVLWTVYSTFLPDNHYVRLLDEMETHTPSEAPPWLQARALPPVMGSLPGYVESWLAGLQDEHPGQPVPVVLVAAEGGGIRAAYWTALVLGQLHDEARAREPTLDFARHTLAISGVSGGSLGAAAYAALVTQPPAGQAPEPCGQVSEVRARAERMLDHDFLSPAVAVMLFPDLFQTFVPVAFINDRAKALERSWQAAWDACEAGERFTQPLQNLWADGAPFATPLLFLNSTVVETGQRIIAAPVPIDPGLFSDALDSRRAIGDTVPLATAVHNSARFAYISPAGLVKRKKAPHEQWLRVVEGGYFENSGAVTLSEILDVVLDVSAERGFNITPVVIHISNDPETSDPEVFDDPYYFGAQISAPIRALLNARPARGFQAREALHRRVLDLNEADEAVRAYHFHFRLCREGKAPLPLGWTLSRAAEQEMRRQLGAQASDDGPIAKRNRSLRAALLAVLAGERPDPRGLGIGFTCPSEQEQMRLATGPDVNF